MRSRLDGESKFDYLLSQSWGIQVRLYDYRVNLLSTEGTCGTFRRDFLQTSRLVTDRAFFSMNSRRGST
jgi:hypothetical protein